MQVIYKDTTIDVKKGISVLELFKDKIRNSNNEIIACKFNNEVKGLNFKIKTNGTIELIDITDKDGMRVYQRGLIFIVAKAFHDLYPDALLTINYQLYHSMLCEVDNINITDQMIDKVNKRVQEIIDRNLPIERRSMSKEEANKFYEKEKTLKGKLQLELKEKEKVTPKEEKEEVKEEEKIITRDVDKKEIFKSKKEPVEEKIEDDKLHFIDDDEF